MDALKKSLDAVSTKKRNRQKPKWPNQPRGENARETPQTETDDAHPGAERVLLEVDLFPKAYSKMAGIRAAIQTYLCVPARACGG
jgi:hypothetical protein